jgi:hypothetical protein
MLMDHACLRFRQLVVSQFGSNNVVWARFQGTQVYPWCWLQVIDGPTSRVEQRKWLHRRQVEWTILAGAVGAPVAARIGGRVLVTTHTGDATTTAAALATQMPSHWTTSRVGAVWTITGPDVLAGFAYEGSTLTSVEIGSPVFGEVVRRELTIQTTVACQLNEQGRPARWDPAGCDTLALKIQTALRQTVPDPYRVYIAPQATIRPFDESYADGREYIGASFDSQVMWVDPEPQFAYGFATAIGAPIETIESVEGTVEVHDGVAADTSAWDVSVDD